MEQETIIVVVFATEADRFIAPGQKHLDRVKYGNAKPPYNGHQIGKSEECIHTCRYDRVNDGGGRRHVHIPKSHNPLIILPFVDFPCMHAFGEYASRACMFTDGVQWNRICTKARKNSRHAIQRRLFLFSTREDANMHILGTPTKRIISTFSFF